MRRLYHSAPIAQMESELRRIIGYQNALLRTSVILPISRLLTGYAPDARISRIAHLVLDRLTYGDEQLIDTIM